MKHRWQKRLTGEYKPSIQEIKHVDEVMKLMSVLTGSSDFETAAKLVKRRGGKITMCEMLDKIKEREKQEGRKEGRREGRQEGRLSVLKELVNDGMLTLQKAAEKADMDVASFELALNTQ